MLWPPNTTSVVAALNEGRAVEKLIVHRHGQTDYGQAGIERTGRLRNLIERGQGTLLEGRLLKKIGTGVARNGQLGKDDEGNPFGLSALEEAQDSTGIVGTVCHAQRRCRGGNTQESMILHRRSSPLRATILSLPSGPPLLPRQLCPGG